jgi:hypothetical protein
MQCVVLQPKLNFRVVQPTFIEKHFHHKKQSFTTNKELRTTCELMLVRHPLDTCLFVHHGDVRPHMDRPGSTLMTTCEHYCLLSAHHKLINNFIMPQASSPRLQMTPAGLEPAIPGSVGRCLIHWATGPIDNQSFIRKIDAPSHMGVLLHEATRSLHCDVRGHAFVCAMTDRA